MIRFLTILFSVVFLGGCCDTASCDHEPEAFSVEVDAYGCSGAEIYLDELAWDEDYLTEYSDEYLTIYFDVGSAQYGELDYWNGGLIYFPYYDSYGREEIYFYVEDDCGQRSRWAKLVIWVDCW